MKCCNIRSRLKFHMRSSIVTRCQDKMSPKPLSLGLSLSWYTPFSKADLTKDKNNVVELVSKGGNMEENIFSTELLQGPNLPPHL